VEKGNGLQRLAARRLAVVECLLPAVALAAACGAGGTATPASGPHTTGTITVDGILRDYILYTPPGLRSKPVPLLLALHGGQQYGDAMEQITGFDSLAEADGFIVAYPNGHGQTWNAGSCCGRPNVTTDNEVDFISALIDRLSAGGRVDRSRVYVTGFSAGAAMAYTIGCRLSNEVAAIAPVAGTMDLDACHPHDPVSVMEIHGTSDIELLYDGGESAGSTKLTPSTPSVVQQWASLDGCTAPQPTEHETGVDVMRWTGCGAGTSVVLDTVELGTHDWYGPQLDGADASIDATKAVWQFVSAQHR
jgi:polyhydroxybutyrate depolymerase